MTTPAVGRIHGRSAFRDLRRPRRRAASGPVRVAYSPTEAAFPQVAYAIGRQTGSAVVRNRIRRRLRAAVREVAGGLPAGAYLLRAERSAAELAFPDLVRAVGEAMVRASDPAVPGVTRT